MTNDFFLRADVVLIARQLLGKQVISDIDGERTSGIIVETEAYSHAGDKAMQQHLKRRRNSAEMLYQQGGVMYLYRSHGHTMLNIVTNTKGTPDAVLIRAIAPVNGTDVMMHRRGLDSISSKLCAGPGMLTQALGITPALNGISVTAEHAIRIKDEGNVVTDAAITASPRVGIAYAGEDASLPWRFRLADNRWTSKAK